LRRLNEKAELAGEVAQAQNALLDVSAGLRPRARSRRGRACAERATHARGNDAHQALTRLPTLTDADAAPRVAEVGGAPAPAPAPPARRRRGRPRKEEEGRKNVTDVAREVEDLEGETVDGAVE